MFAGTPGGKRDSADGDDFSAGGTKSVHMSIAERCLSAPIGPPLAEALTGVEGKNARASWLDEVKSVDVDFLEVSRVLHQCLPQCW